MSSSDSSSEDAEEAQRRLEMASVVVSGADIVNDAAKPTRGQKNRERAEINSTQNTENDEHAGLTMVRSSGGIRRESERRLESFISRSFEVVDNAWNGIVKQKSDCAPSSHLRFFTGSTALQLHQPPSIRMVLDAGASERTGKWLLEQAALSRSGKLESAHGEAAERDVERRAKKERKREKREKKERKRAKKERKARDA